MINIFSQNHRHGEHFSSCQGTGIWSGQQVGENTKKQHKGVLCGNGTVLYLDCYGNMHIQVEENCTELQTQIHTMIAVIANDKNW